MFKRKTEVISFKEFMKKENTDFFALIQEKEVKVNKIRDISIKAYVVLPSVLVTTPAWAEETGVPEIDAGFKKIEFIAISVSSGVAVLCLMGDGLLKMLGIEKPEWTKKIYKGFIQITTAPLAIAIVAAIIHWGTKIFSIH